MILEYHRPKTIEEALALIGRPSPKTLPLGGGTLLSKPTTDSVEVVDLQALGLDTAKKNGNNLEIGATVTLQQLMENENCPDALKQSIKLEAPLNICNAATVAGTLVSCDGRSTFVTALLALDAKIEQAIFDNTKVEYRVSNIGDFLPLRSKNLITKIIFPINTKFAFEFASRTPADKPIVCAALAQWNSVRMRLALGGYGKSPLLAMDGTEADGIDASINSAQAAARNAYHETKDDWASAEYRMDVAATLAKRCIEKLVHGKD